MKSIKHVGIYLPTPTQSDIALERGTSFAETVGAKTTLLSVAKEVCDLSPTRSAVVLQDNSAESIRDVVHESEIELLFKSARPAPCSDEVVGGIGQSLLDHSPCPIWIVRPREASNPTPVIAAIRTIDDTDDPSALATSRRVVAAAAFLAKSESRPLIVAYSWKPEIELVGGRIDRRDQQMFILEHRTWTYKQVTSLVQDATNLPTRIELLRGESSTAITQLAEQLKCDTIVVSRAGRQGLRALLIGSSHEKVITHSFSSVTSAETER